MKFNNHAAGCSLVLLVSLGCQESGGLPPTPDAQLAGKQAYDASCASCHNTSHEGAPRLGFLQAWERRIKQGEETLIQHAIEGTGLMPPKGDSPELTDEQIASIVRYMIYRAGLNIPAGSDH